MKLIQKLLQQIPADSSHFKMIDEEKNTFVIIYSNETYLTQFTTHFPTSFKYVGQSTLYNVHLLTNCV